MLEQEVGSGAPALSSVRAGEILKRGGFACGSKQLSALLSRLLLVLFLAKQEKYDTAPSIKTQETGHRCLPVGFVYREFTLLSTLNAVK